MGHQTRPVAGKIEAHLKVQQAQTDVTQTGASDELKQLPAWLLGRINALQELVQDSPHSRQRGCH